MQTEDWRLRGGMAKVRDVQSCNPIHEPKPAALPPKRSLARKDAWLKPHFGHEAKTFFPSVDRIGGGVKFPLPAPSQRG